MSRFIVTSMRLLTTSNELARMATLNTMLRANSLFCETAIAAELKARYKLLSRRAMDLVLDDAIVNPSVKIAAIHGGLAATRNQVKFSQDLGILKRAPIEFSTSL